MIEIERVAAIDGRIELWAYDGGVAPREKLGGQFLGYEQAIRPPETQSGRSREALCWSIGRTLGNVAVFSEDVLATMPAPSGVNVLLACDIVEAGKMRNGAKRWWCRTHQHHWGTKQDLLNARRDGAIRCANHAQPMSYAVNPPRVRVDASEPLAITYELRPAYCSKGWTSGCQNHKFTVRNFEGTENCLTKLYECEALTVVYSDRTDLLGAVEECLVHLTPPAAVEYLLAVERGVEVGSIHCKDCGWPHLDLGEFADRAHSKHLCSNCGRDGTWSDRPIASTPIKALHDQFPPSPPRLAEGIFNFDDVPSTEFALWPSMPAILWTSKLPQAEGVIARALVNGVVEDWGVFESVIHRGVTINRSDLMNATFGQRM